MSNLTLLDLSGTRVTGPGLEHLQELIRLERLDLSSTPLSDAGLKHLAGPGPFWSLDLADTAVGDAGLEHLARHKLAFLNLARTHVTDAGLKYLEKIPGIMGVNLEGTRVSKPARKPLEALCKEHSDADD